MTVKNIIPTGPEVLREALIVLAGALIAVIVVKAMPANVQSWFTLSKGE